MCTWTLPVVGSECSKRRGRCHCMACKYFKLLPKVNVDCTSVPKKHKLYGSINNVLFSALASYVFVPLLHNFSDFPVLLILIKFMYISEVRESR